MGTNLLHGSVSGSYPRDLNMEAVGSRCYPCNEDKTFENGLLCNGTLPSPTLCRQLGSSKEELRQTILKQEVIFSDQVLELHRLYRRQRELMSKVEKKQLLKQSDYAVNMLHEPRELDLISARPNNLIDLNEPYQVEEGGTTNSVDSLDPGISQREIPGRDPSAKTNSEFGVLFTEKSFGNSETKKKMDACSRPEEQPPCTNEAGHNRSTLVDFQLPLVSSRGRPRHNLERSPIVVLALPAFNAPASAPFNKLTKRSIARSRHTSNKLRAGGSSKCSRRHGPASSKVSSQGSRFESMTSSTDHDFSPGHHAHKEHLKGSDMMDVKSERDMDLNSISPGHSAEMVSQQQSCTMDKNNQSEGKHEMDLNFNFNSCGNVESWPALTVPGASVVAPISPENQECPRPRGESEENPLDLCQGKGTGPLEKPDSIPADESVFTCSARIEACLESVARDLLKAPPINTLDWFATVCLDPTTQSRLVSGNNGAKQEEEEEEEEEDEVSCDDDFDYFEAMTLRLAELKAEEEACKTISSQNKEGEGGAYPTTFLSRAKKGRRGRGRRQKDIQRGILPCLASLARHAEDLQTIGGWVKAAGSPPVTKLASDPGKSRQARGRKWVRASVPDLVKSTVSMPWEQPAANADPGSEERWLTGWGSVRRRGQRHRASNPSPLVTDFSRNYTKLL